MAETAVTVTVLSINTASADLDDASGVVATTPADGWSITPKGSGTNQIVPADPSRLLLKFAADASGDTVVIQSGVRPPSLQADEGDLSITLAANDVKYVWVEYGRFARANGSILATCGDAGTKCNAFQLARG